MPANFAAASISRVNASGYSSSRSRSRFIWLSMPTDWMCQPQLDASRAA